MSSKQTWLQRRASQLKPNAAGGENALPAITTSGIFAGFDDQPSSILLGTFERSGELVFLFSITQGTDTRLAGVKQDGIVLFDRVYGFRTDFIAIVPIKGWIVGSRKVGSTSTTSIFSAGTGLLLGQVSLYFTDCWETSEGRVVGTQPIPGSGTNGSNYEFYELSLDSQRQLQSSYLWTDTDKPQAYHPATDNLLFALTGKCRELLTGTEVWNFDVTDFNGGVNAPHSALAETGFDEEGNAYNLQLRHTRVGDRMEERPFLRKLSFPTKTGSPQTATEEWDYDLSQSFSETNNDYELWGATLGGTIVDIDTGPSVENVLFTDYLIPRHLSLTEDLVWLTMPKLEFAYSWMPTEGCFIVGTPPEGVSLCDETQTGEVVDEYHLIPTVIQIDPETGDLVRQTEFPGLVLVGDLSSSMLTANSSDGGWAIVNFSSEVGESETGIQYQSILATIQNGVVTGPPTLTWESEYGEGAQEVTDTVLPHEELTNAIIGGGAIFYSHKEENDDRSVRKMGIGVFPDHLRRLCRRGPCPPWSVNVAGIAQVAGPAGTQFSGLDVGSAPASMGGGWHMAPYKKVLEGADGQLEFIDGSSNYEKWTLDGGNYIPVHGDNYVKAVKHMDGTFTLTFPDQTKLEFDEYGLVVSEEDRSGNVTTFTYESVSAGEEKDARIESVSDGFGRETEFVYATSDLSDRQPVQVIQKEQGGTNHRTTTLEYDSVTDVLTKVTAPNGDETEYVYYPDGKFHKLIEPGGRVAVTFTYYADGRVETETAHISTEFPNGTVQRHYSYDADKSETTITTKDMHVTDHTLRPRLAHA